MNVVENYQENSRLLRTKKKKRKKSPQVQMSYISATVISLNTDVIHGRSIKQIITMSIMEKWLYLRPSTVLASRCIRSGSLFDPITDLNDGEISTLMKPHVPHRNSDEPHKLLY